MHGDGLIRRTPIDEGNFSATPSPVGNEGQYQTDMDLLDEIETLVSSIKSCETNLQYTKLCSFKAVPTWEDPDRTRESVSRQENKDEVSFTSSRPSSIDSKASLFAQDKYNPQLVRMLHQIQADIKVKEELVAQLEKSETEYAFMRRKFDDKMSEMQAQLAELQRERDAALMRTRSRFSTNSDVAFQIKEKQQLIDIRHAYEAKIKSQLSEIQELKRKFSQANMNMQATRNQKDTLLRSLKANVESLQMEKKRMLKRMKAETEKVREQLTSQERRIQQLQRQQAEANMVKRRLEREAENHKQMLKKRNEEILMNHNQLKQLISVLKQAVREGGILDERLLGKVSHIVGGNFAIVARGGLSSRRNNRKRVNPIPLHIRVSRKKELLDKALCQFIQSKQAVVEMEQLLVRRERLAAEKLELLEERKNIFEVEKENAEKTGAPMDTMAIELMDERIDLMSAEISYLSARIRALQSEAAGDSMDEEEHNANARSYARAEKRVTFADEIVSDPAPNDEWADMDAFEEQFSVPSNAAPEMAYDITIKLLKSLEPDECKRIAESLVEEIMNLRMSECNRQVTQQNMEKTVMDLRRTLIVMKRAAIATTVENERRIRKLEAKLNKNTTTEDSPMDAKIEEFINSGNTIFDKIYEDGLRGMITTPEPELVATKLQAAETSNSSVTSFPEEALGSAGPSSPRKSPTYVNGPPKPPKPLSDRRGSASRDDLESPDHFYNMIQKRLSQQRAGGSVSPIPITMISPAEFARYAAERDSSGSSIRSSHLRRSSLQSDYSSSQSQNSWNNTFSSTSQGSQRKRAYTLQQQQQQQQPRHRTSLRELSLMGSNHAPMPNGREFNESDVLPQPPLPPSSPLANYSLQRVSKRASIPAIPTSERSVTPSHNVFDRLSQTPTRASRAKMAYQRHSSGSVDELKRRWDAMEELQGRASSPFC